MRTTMSIESPVSKCTCTHLFDSHNGECQSRRGNGMCKCRGFVPSTHQPHTETLDLLTKSIRMWGFAPTIRELAETLGVSSSSTMQARLDVLEGHGLIERVGPRAIKLTEGTL